MAKAKTKTTFVCQECGYETPKWMGKCPSCGQWNTIVEEAASPFRSSSGRGFVRAQETAVPIIEIDSTDNDRIVTNNSEWNRVLGGGIVPGSLILLGGDPGIGKSTLLLQVSRELTEQNRKVLYISGEESVRQTKLRADRLGAVSPLLYVLCETNLEYIMEAVADVKPDFLVIDSIQTVYHPDIGSAPGSVAQVRENTAHFMRIAKGQGIATVLVGHVTKEGAIAGPRLLEHMVDCVLYFEGERHHSYRLLRSVKNRFGSTNEIGVFEMRENGLVEVRNPSELFLPERDTGVSGSAVVAGMEGTRPMLVELQALVTATTFPAPRRMSAGFDNNRLALIIAVLEKRIGMVLQNQDVYLNAAGGVRLEEPAADLAVAVSVASSFREHPTEPDTVIVGEIGLTGEVRTVSKIDQRVREAQKLGFKRAIVPASGTKGWKPPEGMEIVGVRTVAEALSAAMR